MTDFATMLQPDRGQAATIIRLVEPDGFDPWLRGQSERTRTSVAAQQLKPKAGRHAIIAGDSPADWFVIAVVGSIAKLSPWCLAGLAAALPPGRYRLDGAQVGAATLGWLAAQHGFTRYKHTDDAAEPRVLLTDQPQHLAMALHEAIAVATVRDLVDTPAADMGPADLDRITHDLAKSHQAVCATIKGDALETGYPMISAVGRAAPRDRAPRLIDLHWGDQRHPRITIVGKGVTFDSGGLNIKPTSGMALMKKDMGGAAHAIALAGLIMAAGLPVRLHLLIAAVENSISGEAMRPGDVLTSRAGTTVEIDNTDAEGRLILADALSRAVEDGPELIVDFATLTGAARVALGPDLPALFSNDDTLAQQILDAGTDRDDPVWRLPLWDGYDDMLKSDIADLTNAPAGGFAGSITAALFLRRFVPPSVRWAHLDTFAWRPAAKPGRPKGGAALGLLAVWTMLDRQYRR